MVLELLFTSTIKETVSWFTEHFTPNIFLLSYSYWSLSTSVLYPAICVCKSYTFIFYAVLKSMIISRNGPNVRGFIFTIRSKLDLSEDTFMFLCLWSIGPVHGFGCWDFFWGVGPGYWKFPQTLMCLRCSSSKDLSFLRLMLVSDFSEITTSIE